MNAVIEMNRVRSAHGLEPALSGENVIHFSSVPWIRFTSLSHARSFSHNDSIPKISFGKMTITSGVRSMPVSVHVHHGLMDGFHVGSFLDHFQELLLRG
jgi:chloramphenicol O-acetyltransferase type A